SIALAGGAVLLGVGVVIGGALIAGGLHLNSAASPSASGLLPSAVSSSSMTPSSVVSGIPSPTAPTPTPAGTPWPANSAFSIFPAQPPAELPTITCSGSIGASDPVALVDLRPIAPAVSRPLVLRDYADLANPQTVCTFPNWAP